jgi:lipopolysaccharide biosynthesis glycosyltransferase
VTLVSVLAHLDARRHLTIHVIDGDIPESERTQLARSLGFESVTLSWHLPDRSRFVGVPLWGRMPISVYDKLLVPDLLPREVDQALWLDSDTLVLGDIALLWDQGAGCHPVLAAQDSLVPLVSSSFGVARYRELGLRADAKYFNAGVMLMELELWRRQHVSSRALDYVKAYASEVSFWDQEGLNAVLAGEWGELDPVWNWSVSRGHPSGQPTIDRRAKIVHFTGNMKPWKYDGRHTYYREYYEYVDRSAWPGWRPAPNWRAAALRSYERSAFRRMAFPIEQLATKLQRVLTARLATAEDVRSIP